MINELHARLGAIRRRWRTVIGARTLGRALMGAALPLAAAVVMDLLIAPRDVALLLLGLTAVLASAGFGGAIAWRGRRRPGDRQIARFIEERIAQRSDEAPLGDALVSAVDAMDRDSPFGRLVVAGAVSRLREIPPSSVVPPSMLNRALAQGVAGAAVFALVAVAARGPAVRFYETAQGRLFPGAIQLSIVPGDARVVAGHPLRVRASVRGADALLDRLTPVLTADAAGEQHAVRMTRQPDGFEYVFDSVDRSFRYRVSLGAASSREYAVTALFPPRVQRIDLRYTYPAFARLPSHDETGSGDIYAPEGTRVRLRVQTDRPASGGELAFGRLPAAGLHPAGDRILEGEIVLSREDSYRVRLSGLDGLRSDGDLEYFIRLVDDRPPDVRILRPSGDQKITPLEEVTIEARADDDYGIAGFDLVYWVAGRPPRVVPFTRMTGTTVEKLGTHLLAAEELRVQPGDVVTYYARARDVARGKQSTEARSDIFFLEVKPFNAEFAAAESQAMAGASDAQIDALVAAQKEIINATWNLERRSGAGRSAADLSAVAEAQARLKRRTEQMGGRPGPRGWRRPPQQVAMSRPRPAAQTGGDPVASAIEAMDRALQQLRAERTRDAIPHEMEALRALLQAQARRREVAQQQAGSGAGSGRQGEDLSALFDKELQRQQRTNYETKSQIESRPEAEPSDATADRVRDLAKRQEDLSQRQRDLARAGVPEAERRRQLEKLVREQDQLRSELGQLAKGQLEQSAADPQRQQGTSGQQPHGQSQQQAEGRGTAAGGASNGMRSASEQMRAATADLQRQNPDGAAGSAARAADELRRLERQLRAGSAGGRDHAAGDLRLEAQQIAQEQQRIAGESERLARGSGGDEGKRRLAADKERLADRVDALRRSAGAIARNTDKQGAARAAAEAARAIDEQRVAERMRETARALRGQPGAGGAGVQQTLERELARTMQGVADKLGGSDSSDAQRLAGELDRTRRVRERLNDLERRIRELESRDAAARGGRGGRQSGRASEGTRSGSGGEELERLRSEYSRELQRARDAFAPAGKGEPRGGTGTATPEQQEYSRSAPGTEAFKQDFSAWDRLRRDIDLALEKHDADVSARLMRKLAADRLSAGGSDRVPEEYSAMIARYYEQLAKVKK